MYSHTIDDPKNEDDLRKKDKKTTKMNVKYDKERTKRYVKNNKRADKFADLGGEMEDIYTPKLNKYMNEFLLVSTRKNKTKKSKEYKQVINTRVRKEVKDMLREEARINLLKKEKYSTLHQYMSNISKNSQMLIKSKMHIYEDSKKMMIRMIHQSLPTCDKMYRLVTSE